MDEGKILVVNLSKGLIGEDNAAILGAFIVTKVQLAAMSRSDIPLIENRRPFYLYVDEFQNFATDSFAVILSEARKYGLNLTVANQYVAQMTDSVRDAVFGNVGTTISFRVSADDAPVLAKQFEPTFDESDIIQLNNRHFVISMIINGEKVPAFSATTLSIPDTPKDNFEAIVAHSREYFARPRMEVEAEIRETIEQSERYKRELADSGRQEPRMVIEGGEERPVFAPVEKKSRPERKPNTRKPATPQGDFRRQNLSPNAAEGREALGLKDLAKLVGVESEKARASEKEVVPGKEGTKFKKNKPNKQNKQGKQDKQGGQGEQTTKKPVISSPVNPSPAPVNTATGAASGDAASSPVHPEVEYQEKSMVEIQPTHHSLPLSTPVQRSDHHASKDNSVDGFLAIKH